MIAAVGWGLALAGGCVAGLVSHAIAAHFAADATPRPVVFVVLQAAVAGVGMLAAPPGDALATLALGWTLALLAVIDATILRLPDILTFPLAAIGLVVAAIGPKPALPDHLIGAASGYAAFALLAAAYARLRGREGLGLGDAKLLGCAGAWVGWRPLPGIVVAAALAGIAWAILARMRRGAAAWREPHPFGVPLAIATWAAWLILARKAT